jgi:hypothetical protein
MRTGRPPRRRRATTTATICDPLRIQGHHSQSMTRLFSEVQRLEGWLGPIDAALFETISAAQHERAIGGDILEIGAYKGKSAIVLGTCLAPDERLVVCDLFGSPSVRKENVDENLSYYAGLERQDFESNYLGFHNALPEIHQCEASDLEARLTNHNFRFVHVDGSHLFDEVRSDIALSRKISRRGGVVAFDDIHSGYELGVGAAVWHEVVSGELIPRLATGSKLYCAWDQEGVAALEKGLGLLCQRGEVHTFGPVHIAGEPVWRTDPADRPSARRALVRDLAPPALYRAASRWKNRVRLIIARRRAK